MRDVNQLRHISGINNEADKTKKYLGLQDFLNNNFKSLKVLLRSPITFEINSN